MFVVYDGDKRCEAPDVSTGPWTTAEYHYWEEAVDYANAWLSPTYGPFEYEVNVPIEYQEGQFITIREESK